MSAHADLKKCDRNTRNGDRYQRTNVKALYEETWLKHRTVREIGVLLADVMILASTVGLPTNPNWSHTGGRCKFEFV